MSAPLLLLAWAAFLALAAAVLLTGVLPGDEWVRQTVLAHAAPPVVEAMRWINLVGTWRVLLPVALGLLLFPRTRRRWWLWLLVLLLASGLEFLLKPVIGRPRPESPAFGFPSGHATAAAAYLTALAYAAGDLPPLGRRLVRVAAACLIVGVGLARIVLHAHWPSDVLGGMALGLGCAGLAALVERSRRGNPALQGGEERRSLW